MAARARHELSGLRPPRHGLARWQGGEQGPGPYLRVWAVAVVGAPDGLCEVLQDGLWGRPRVSPHSGNGRTLTGLLLTQTSQLPPQGFLFHHGED